MIYNIFGHHLCFPSQLVSLLSLFFLLCCFAATFFCFFRYFCCFVPILFCFLPMFSSFCAIILFFSLLDGSDFVMGNGQRGIYSLLSWSNGGIGQTRPREAPACTPDCPKFSSDALARCPQTLPSTYTFWFVFFEDVVGANGTAAHEGSSGFSLLTTCWGGVCPRKST